MFSLGFGNMNICSLETFGASFFLLYTLIAGYSFIIPGLGSKSAFKLQTW